MGSTSGNWDGGGGSDSGSGLPARTPSGSPDFAAVKLEAGGKEVWRFQVRGWGVRYSLCVRVGGGGVRLLIWAY